MAYQGFGLDGLVLCLDCGAVVADGWQQKHTEFHLQPDRVTEAVRAALVTDMHVLGETLKAKLRARG